MPGTVNLKPEVGTELAAGLSKVLDGTVLEVIQTAYDGIRALGDDNHIVESIKEKFMKIQEKYNGDLVPAANSVKAKFEAYTDYAEYVSKLSIDTGVKDVDVGSVKPNNYDAAKNL